MKIIPHQVGDTVFMIHSIRYGDKLSYAELIEVTVYRRRDRKNKHGTKLMPTYDVRQEYRTEFGPSHQEYGLVPHDKLLTREAAVAWKLRNGSKIQERVHAF